MSVKKGLVHILWTKIYIMTSELAQNTIYTADRKEPPPYMEGVKGFSVNGNLVILWGPSEWGWR